MKENQHHIDEMLAESDAREEYIAWSGDVDEINGDSLPEIDENDDYWKQVDIWLNIHHKKKETPF